MNTIKSAVAVAAVAFAVALSGCTSLQPTDANDILASMAASSDLGGE
jgi:hypothetical protein